MASFYFVFMMNYVEVVVINSFVNYFVKLVWLARKAVGAPPVTSVAESPLGRYMPRGMDRVLAST
jgi:hypothetical protein